MEKTITIRIEDSVYQLFKKAAEGDKRSISNFIEYATIQYISDDIHVTDEEMNEILNDKDLVGALRKGLKSAKAGKYKIVS